MLDIIRCKIFSKRVSFLILTISLGEIKEKLWLHLYISSLVHKLSWNISVMLIIQT